MSTDKPPPADELTKGEIEEARQAAMDEGRAQKAFLCLFNLLTVAKTQCDIGTWLNEGAQDLEDFFDALRTGADHPLLGQWKRRRSANRPPPDTREQHTRRLVHLMCVALERAQLGKAEARKLAAKKLARVLPDVSDVAIRYWQRQEPPLTELDERVIANALNRCGPNHELLADHFIGFLQARRDPFVRFVPD